MALIDRQDEHARAVNYRFLFDSSSEPNFVNGFKSVVNLVAALMPFHCEKRWKPLENGSPEKLIPS